MEIRQRGTGKVLARVEGSTLAQARLAGANLTQANLMGADLRGADLRGANLRGALLYEVNLDGANLDDADLEGAQLWHASCRGAILTGANLRGPYDGSYVWGADFISASFDERTHWSLCFSATRRCSPSGLGEVSPAAPPGGRGTEPADGETTPGSRERKE
jgi:uncharacterized protein YjbI with pentapeptide repeats